MVRALLIVFMLAGCHDSATDPDMLRYSQDEADKAMAKMVFCAHAVRAIKTPLPNAAKDAIYADCLIQNKATI